jgi:transposase
VRRNKNDKIDAEAVCEAMSRPRVRERQVPIKSIEQSAAQMLIGVRKSLIQRRTQIINSLRGHAAEFGRVVGKGPSKIGELLARIAQDAEIPALSKEMFALLERDLGHVGRLIAEVEKKLMTMHRGNELSRRLVEVPTIGPVGAVMLAVKVVNPHGFRSGRMCSAWVGLTPKDHSTAGKQTLGGITRAGDEDLRAVLVNGATAYIQQVRRGRIKASPWLADLLKRKPPKLAAVALANKTVRIAWKLMVSGERYDPQHEARKRAHEAAASPEAGVGFAGMRGSSMMPGEAGDAAR